jgi:hypothetical protein
MRNVTVYNFNALNNQMTTLLSDDSSVRLDAVSLDGQSLLYEEASADTRQVNYATFSVTASTRNFYHLAAGQAGNAIWIDNQRILVSDMRGSVLALNAATGALQQSWAVQTSQLAFYNQPFLYFVGADNLTASALYRINLAQDQALPQQVTRSSPNTHFWLSPDGTTVVYANRGTTGEEGIYAVDSDGSHERLLQPGAGMPLGYTANKTLLSLQQVGSRIEAIRLTTTLPEQSQVVLADAAPDAASLCLQAQSLTLIALCDQNIALAPSGRGLLLHTYYADGSHSLVYDDLTTGVSRKIKDLASGTTVQLPGWSKISSGQAQTSFTLPATLCA